MAKQIDIRYTPDRNSHRARLLRFDDAPEKWLDEYEDQDGTLYWVEA